LCSFTRYKFAVPLITFSFGILIDDPEKDHKWLLTSNIGIWDPVRKERLRQMIKVAISDFEQL
jgi:hypothetical protein